MQRINDVISPELIKLSLNGKNKVEVIEELTDLLFKTNKLTSRADYIATVYERESTLSTYCGNEVAIPHAISSAVKTPAVCFGRSEGFNWDHQLDEWVRFVFLFAIPEKSHVAENHISIISSIARSCLGAETRKIWQNATSEDQIIESFKYSIGS